MSGLQNRLDRARSLAERGLLEEADRQYGAILQQAPDHLDTLIEAGVVAAQLGSTGTAMARLTAALSLAPDDPTVHLNLAELNLETGDLEAAQQHFEACLRSLPDDVDALFGLGDTLRLLGRMDEAYPLLMRAVRAAPDDPEILNAFGVAAEAQGHGEQARNAYRRAMEIAPEFQNARVNLALNLSTSGDLKAACALFAEADRRGPLDATALVGWANAALRSDAFEQAEALCDRAADAGADAVQVLALRGTLHESLGDFEAAREAYRKAVEEDSGAAYAWSRLAHMRALPATARDTLEHLLADGTRHASERSAAGFALYRLHDQAGEYDEAFDALSRANALVAEAAPFDAERHKAAADATIGLFDAEFLRSAPKGYDREGPVFIIGLPRSGTTLVEQILAHYDEVHAGGERFDIQNLIRSLTGYPKGLSDQPESWARETGERVFSAMTADSPGARLATNKTPANYEHCGLISWLLPRARIIYCRRDPRDVALSIYAQDFRDGVNYANDLDNIAFVYRQHMRYMQHWFDVLPDRIHTVDYEALVHDCVPVARALVDCCGLEWDDGCIVTQDVQRPIHTASVWQVRQPINAASVGRWKNYERYLSALIEAVE